MSERSDLVAQLLAEAERSNGIATALLEAMTELVQATNRVNEAAQGLADLDWRVAANVLAILRKVTNDILKPIDASLVRHLYLTAPHGEIEIDGLGVMAVRRSKETRHWMKEEALGAVLDAHMADIETGEVPPPWEVLRWFIDACGIDYLRTNYLRGLNINPEAYRTTEPGKPEVRFT